jgi:hypothetical protein
MILKKIANSDGMAALIALMIMLMLTFIGVAAIKISSDEVTIAGNEMNEMTSFYGAEAGLERAAAAVEAYYVAHGGPPSIMPSGSESVTNCTVAYNTVDNGPAQQSVLTLGTLAGLHALIKTYAITANGTSQVDGSKTQLSMDFQAALVPLFQFAVFYGNDLEIAPGPDMTLIGRVHSNGSLWIQANTNLNMESYVSCSGNLLHGRKGPGAAGNGNVYIKDTDGNYKNMKNADGTFLQSTSANWFDSATSRWGGRVQDATFGQKEINPLLTGTSDAHKYIERSTGNPDSYENKAGLKIIDGVAYALIGGVWSDITALLPAGTITTNAFYDGREATNVRATDVDISLLKTTAYYPANGVIYASDQRSGAYNGLRLKNGSDLGRPLSVLSENPLYVKGDYNSVNKQPAALGADAVTFLSNSWADSNSTLALNNRVASATLCNASIMTGNTNTTATDYNGGLENLPRFLEKWDGITFTYSGSLINLWNSQQATGTWSYGSYYTAPTRQWSYDTDLDDPAKLPPATPCARIFQRTGWKQEYVGYSGA